MEIPKTLQSTWNEVSKDNKIDKSEFKQLVNAAREDGKLEQGEINLLSAVKDSITSNSKEGSAEVKNISFVESDKTISEPEYEWAKTLEYKVQQDDYNPTNQEKEAYTKIFNKFTDLTEIDGPEVTPNQEVTHVVKSDSDYRNQAFTGDFKKSDMIGTERPYLKGSVSSIIAKDLGAHSVKELQKKVGASIDGKYGAETHDKVKKSFPTGIAKKEEIDWALDFEKKVSKGHSPTPKDVEKYNDVFQKVSYFHKFR